MHRRGISLIEIVVVLTIVGILLAIGIPAIQQHEASQAVRTQADQLVSALNLVRSGRISQLDPQLWATALIDPQAQNQIKNTVPNLPKALHGENPQSQPIPTQPTTLNLFELEQVTGGQTQTAEVRQLAQQVTVSVQNGTGLTDALPDTCSALVISTPQSGAHAVVFLPSGKLFFSANQPAQNVQILLASPNVPTSTITVTPVGSISVSQ